MGPLSAVRLDFINHFLHHGSCQHPAQQLVHHPGIKGLGRGSLQKAPWLACFVRQARVVAVHHALAPRAVADLQLRVAYAAPEQTAEPKAAFGSATDFVGGSVFHHGLHLFKIFFADDGRMAGYADDFRRGLGLPAFFQHLVEQSFSHVAGVLQDRRDGVFAPSLAVAQQPRAVHAQGNCLGSHLFSQCQAKHPRNDGRFFRVGGQLGPLAHLFYLVAEGCPSTNKETFPRRRDHGPQGVARDVAGIHLIHHPGHHAEHPARVGLQIHVLVHVCSLGAPLAQLAGVL
nr:hypothetical protein [uncultured Albidiferax sp.]